MRRRPETHPTARQRTETRARASRHPLRSAVLGLIACLMVLGMLGLGTTAYLGYRLDASLERLDGVFDGLTGRPERPTRGVAGEAVNVLVLGSDRRSEVPTTGSRARTASWRYGEQRSDSIMVLHLDGDRQGGAVISIPRDAWVQVPGHGMAKVNAAFSYGGPRLAVATVEELTGVRIDHVAIIDWDGFADLTDDLGGVAVTVPETVVDSARGITWTAGTHELDGEQALAYVGQRYGLPLGDLDRVRRQQAVVRALAGQALRQDLLADPRAAYDLLTTLARHLSVDDTWSLRDMAATLGSMRGLDHHDISYLTVPTRGVGRVGGQSVVWLDRRANRALWSAVLVDDLGGWLSANSGLITPTTVR